MIDIGVENVNSSVSIFYTNLQNYTYLKTDVLNHRKKYPETNETNVKSSWTSSYYTHHETDKFNSLITLSSRGLSFGIFPVIPYAYLIFSTLLLDNFIENSYPFIASCFEQVSLSNLSNLF